MDSLQEKLKETFAFIKKVYFSLDYYPKSLLACFVSRSPLILLGAPGCGKTLLMETLLRMIDPSITHLQPGVLSLELEDVLCRPALPSFDVIFKKCARSTIRGWDEVNRLSPSTLSALFRLVTTGEVHYLDQVAKTDPWWDVCTCNPMDDGSDMIGVPLPPAFLDRFECLWIPVPGAENQLKCVRAFVPQIPNNRKEDVLKNAPVIWQLEDLRKLWQTCEGIEIEKELQEFIVCACRVYGTCALATGRDGASLGAERKRALCASSCNSAYLCSQVVNAPSVRALESLVRVSKGWAFINGRSKVLMKDIENAWPIVFWNRLTFREEEPDRLKKLRTSFQLAKTDIQDCGEAFEIIRKLEKGPFDDALNQRLLEFKSSKVWFTEIYETLERQIEENADFLNKAWSIAQDRNDKTAMANIAMLAYNTLPSSRAKDFDFKCDVQVELSESNLQELEDLLSPQTFKAIKASFKKGLRHYNLGPPDSVRWMLKFPYSEPCHPSNARAPKNEKVG